MGETDVTRQMSRVVRLVHHGGRAGNTLQMFFLPEGSDPHGQLRHIPWDSTGDDKRVVGDVQTVSTVVVPIMSLVTGHKFSRVSHEVRGLTVWKRDDYIADTSPSTNSGE
jgi:hypothetical protein